MKLPQGARQFVLAAVFAAIHTALCILLVIGIYTSTDPEAAMGLASIYSADYPVSPLYLAAPGLGPAGILMCGGFLWFCYGYILQSLIFIRRPGAGLRLAAAGLIVALSWLIPEISLKMKPPWEEQWYRAWALGHGSAADQEKAIHYVSEAIRLSPKDNEKLGELWSFLGDLYFDQKDYRRAEAAFKSYLAVVQARPSPAPLDLLGPYGALGVVYDRTGNVAGRKECLAKTIALQRIIHGGDSIQEAMDWQELAETTHNSGDSKEAQVMLERAITMYADLHDQTAPLGYLKHKLKKWQTE